MNRKLIFLNLVLLALAGWLFWMLRMKWLELHQHEHTVLALSAQVRARIYPPPPNPSLKPIAATDYNNVAQLNIFSKDRNPNVILDPPPPPPPAPPPPPMPALPAFYGTMALFGDPVILLSVQKGPQKKYHAGDRVGPFQLVSFDDDKIVFDWNGKKIERNPADLKDKEPPPVQAAAAAGGPPMPAQQERPKEPEQPERNKILGADNGGGVRMCVPGDRTPAGTVIDGYKKVVTQNMFGLTCMWQQVNP